MHRTPNLIGVHPFTFIMLRCCTCAVPLVNCSVVFFNCLCSAILLLLPLALHHRRETVVSQSTSHVVWVSSAQWMYMTTLPLLGRSDLCLLLDHSMQGRFRGCGSFLVHVHHSSVFTSHTLTLTSHALHALTPHHITHSCYSLAPWPTSGTVMAVFSSGTSPWTTNQQR